MVKLSGMLLLVFVVFVTFALTAAAHLNRSFEQSLLTNLSAITGAITAYDPDAEQVIIAQIKQMNRDHAQTGADILAGYGLTDRELLYETEVMQKHKRHLYLFTVICIGLLFGLLSFIYHRFLKQRYSIVHRLTQYANNIVAGRETLDIRDNDEGEFSVLKNEVYKITSMLKEQAAKLHKDKIALSDSIADISHQLKTPMTSLSVLSDLLENNPDQPMREQFLRKMRSQLDRMEWLVTSLLTLAKLDADTLELKQESFTAAQLIDHALTQLEIPLDIKNQRVSVSGNERMELNGDFKWTSEALINILKNAIEHTPEHGTIRIVCEDNPIYARLIIADQGEGIDREDLPYVFNRFYKGKNARDDSVGVGLAMAFAIIKKQSGDLSVSSTPGHGSQFVITFYRKPI